MSVCCLYLAKCQQKSFEFEQGVGCVFEIQSRFLCIFWFVVCVSIFKIGGAVILSAKMRLVVFDVDVELVEGNADALFVKGFLRVFEHVEFDCPIIAVVAPEFAG